MYCNARSGLGFLLPLLQEIEVNLLGLTVGGHEVAPGVHQQRLVLEEVGDLLAHLLLDHPVRLAHDQQGGDPDLIRDGLIPL